MSAKLETVNTLQLRTGDIVHVHGGRFQLIDPVYRKAATVPGFSERVECDPSEATLIAWGSIVIDRGSLIPPQWLDSRRGWTIQGNEHATWSREVRTDDTDVATCDWGHAPGVCHAVAVANRRDPETGQWLPVCEKHRRS